MRIIFAFLLFSFHQGTAQMYVGGNSTSSEMNASPLGFIQEIRVDNNEVKGTTYLFDNWMTAVKIILVNGSVLTEKLVRFNLATSIMEVRMDGTIKGIQGKYIKAFEIADDHTSGVNAYVAGSDYTVKGVPLAGFLKQIAFGNMNIYALTKIEKLKAGYVAALDAGEPVDQLVKKSKYYFGDSKELKEIETNPKKFAANFPGKEKQIRSYMREAKLSLKKENDLVLLFAFINAN
jgi:hypothetical protein